MKIYELTKITDDVVEAFERLMPQLADISPPTRDDLELIISSDASRLFLARDPESAERIVGAASLGIYRTPTGVHAWIEDVVVDTTARGKGVGEALSRVVIEVAVEAGAKTISLTSRPARNAANRLYQRLGFIKWETNLYRYPAARP